MAHMTSDGKRKSSKFRQSRYNREHAEDNKPEKEEGERAQANKIEAKPQGNPMMHGMGEEEAEEQVHPGIHDEIKQIAEEHGPAHTVNLVHDHEAMKSHVHSIHADGHEHHADHDGEEHVMHAHHHAAHAAGVQMPEEEHEPEEMPEHMGGDEEYGEPL